MVSVQSVSSIAVDFAGGRDQPEHGPLLRISKCPFCGDALTSLNSEGDCPGCGSHARLRTFVPVMSEVVAPMLEEAGSPRSLPLLAFGMTNAERSVLEPHFARFKSVSLYGSYASDHVAGVDARDLSRFDPDSFSGHFSVLLFDYFEEQEKALNDAFRVMAPGGVFITHIAPYRLTDDAARPRVTDRIIPHKGYFDYLPAGASLPHAKVGRLWFVEAMRRSGFEVRWLQAEDVPSGRLIDWFIGRKPQKARARQPVLVTVKPPRPDLSLAQLAGERLATSACPICKTAAKDFAGKENCPGCNAPTRVRTLAPVIDTVLAPMMAGREELLALPLLAFAMDRIEQRLLDQVFTRYHSASLYGQYNGSDHEVGVDARDLSRYGDGAFCGLFSIALYDYFVEHDQALREAFRVIAPGGILCTYIMPYRLVDGDRAPLLDHMMKPGYFAYMPPEERLPSVKVGRDWFVGALQRAGFEAVRFRVHDAVLNEEVDWFVGVKPQTAAAVDVVPVATMSAFDSEYGTDTDGDLPLWDFHIDSPNARFGGRYQPTSPQALVDTVAFLGEDPAGFTFVDLGCGKGRMLLIAAELGFRSVVGVEFVKELADIAAANIAKLGLANASVWVGDATGYRFPPGDLVVYLYNSFSVEVLRPVLDNLRRSGFRNLYFVYKNPKYAGTLDESGFLAPVGSPPGEETIVVYKGIPRDAVAATVAALGPADMKRIEDSWATADSVPASGMERAPIRCFSLMDVDHRCGPRCADRIAAWSGYFRTYEDARCPVSDIALPFGGRLVELTQFAMPQATIDIPRDIAEYDGDVGQKTRNMVRKAQRLGFAYRKANAADLLDEIFAIRTSATVRQGLPVPARYFDYPPPVPVDATGYCPRHDEQFFGVFKDDRLIAYCTINFFGEVARLGEFLGHKDYLNTGVMNLLVHEVVRTIIEEKPWVRGLNFLYVVGWDGLASFKKHAGFFARRTLVTRATPAIAVGVEAALNGRDPPAPGPAVAGLEDILEVRLAAPAAPSGYLFGGSFAPPVDAEKPSGFETALAQLALPRLTRALCVGGGAWIPHGAVAGLVGQRFRPFVLEWRREDYAAVLREEFGATIELVDTAIDEFAPGQPFGLVAVDLFATDFLRTISVDLHRYAALLDRDGILVTRFVYDLEKGLDPEVQPRFRDAYIKRFGGLSPSMEEIAIGFRGSDFLVRGCVDRLNGRGSSSGDGWLVLQKCVPGGLQKTVAGEPIRTVRPAGHIASPAPQAHQTPLATLAAEPDAIFTATAEALPVDRPAAAARPAAVTATPFLAKAVRPEVLVKTFSTPLDPVTGFKRISMKVTLPALPEAAVGCRFAIHPFMTDLMLPTSVVYAAQNGGIVVSEDMGEHWEFVPTPETGNITIQNVFAASNGHVLLQGTSPHRPTDPRGHADLHAPIFVCNQDLKVIDRVQPGRSNWHGPRAIDEARNTIVYAEYPENATKYRPDFQDNEAKLRHLCDDAAVFRSTDNGRTWKKVLEQSWRQIRHFHTAVADPFLPKVWYVSSGDQPEECRIWRSDDDAQTWTEITSDGSGVHLHPVLKGKHGSIHRHTDMVVLPDRVIWGTDDLLGPPRLFNDPEVMVGSRVGSRVFSSPKTNPLQPTAIAYVGSHVRSIVDVGPAYVLLTEAKSLIAAPRPQVCLLFKSEPCRLIELFTVDRYHASGTGFTFSRSSRAAKGGRFFSYRDSSDMFDGGSRILQWDIAFE